MTTIQLTTCSICLEEDQLTTELYKTPCNHYFHNSCIETWLERSGTCPLCRFHLVPEEDYFSETESEVSDEVEPTDTERQFIEELTTTMRRHREEQRNRSIEYERRLEEIDRDLDSSLRRITERRQQPSPDFLRRSGNVRSIEVLPGGTRRYTLNTGEVIDYEPERFPLQSHNGFRIQFDIPNLGFGFGGHIEVSASITGSNTPLSSFMNPIQNIRVRNSSGDIVSSMRPEPTMIPLTPMVVEPIERPLRDRREGVIYHELTLDRRLEMSPSSTRREIERDSNFVDYGIRETYNERERRLRREEREREMRRAERRSRQSRNRFGRR